MFRKMVVLVMVLSLAVCGVAGCSSDSSDSEDSSSSDSENDLTLADYIGIEVEQVAVEITDDDIDEYIAEIVMEYVEVDRAVEDGDYIELDYTVYIDGEEDEDWSDSGSGMTVGDYEIFDEFDDAVIGAEVGDDVEVELDLSDYDESYEDCDVTCVINITAVYEIVIEDITDDYVQENTEYETVEEYRQAIYDELLADESATAIDDAEYDAWYAVVDASVLNSYSDELYEEKYEYFYSDMEYYAELFGYDDADEFIEDWGYDDDTIKEEVESYIKEELVLEAIVEAEGIELTDDEYDEGLSELAEEYGYDDVDEFSEEYDTDDVYDYLLQEKVMEFIYDNAVITEVSEEEYYGEDEE